MIRIAEGQKISFKNVVSKYYQFYSSETGEIVESFFNLLNEKNLTPNGPLFYSIQSDMGQEPIIAIYSIPVEEDRLADLYDEDLEFQTYFLIDHMVRTRMEISSASEAEEQSKIMTEKLLEYIYDNGMTRQSQFYNLIRIVDEKTYLEVYLKATRLFKSERAYNSFIKKVRKKFLRGGKK